MDADVSQWEMNEWIAGSSPCAVAGRERVQGLSGCWALVVVS